VDRKTTRRFAKLHIGDSSFTEESITTQSLNRLAIERTKLVRGGALLPDGQRGIKYCDFGSPEFVKHTFARPPIFNRTRPWGVSHHAL
jgi:hypothetical protein